MIPFDQYHDTGRQERARRAACCLPPAAARRPRCARADPRAGRTIRTRRRSSPKQLIQKTVTSSPTPGYVARVAAVFKDNGKGVRGDLAAVTRADPARSGGARRAQDRPRIRAPARAGAVLDRDDPRARRDHRRRASRMPDGYQQQPAPVQRARRCSATTRPTTRCRRQHPGAGVRHLHVGRIPEPREPDQRPALQRRPVLVAANRSTAGARSGTCRTRSARRVRRSAAFLADAANPDALVERLESPVPARDDERRDAQDASSTRSTSSTPTDPLRRVKMAINLILASSTTRCRNEGPDESTAAALPSPQRRRLLQVAGRQRPARRDRAQSRAGAVGAGLQGAGLRLPAGRQRRREHADPRTTPPATRITRRSGRRRPASTSRRRSCCRSSRRAAARRSGSIRRARRCRRCSTRSSSPCVANVGMLAQPSTQALASRRGRRAATGEPVLAHATRSSRCRAPMHTRLHAHRLGRAHRGPCSTAPNPGTLFPPLTSIDADCRPSCPAARRFR